MDYDGVVDRRRPNNPTYREQAAKAGPQVREENGTKTACDAIEQVLHP